MEQLSLQFLDRFHFISQGDSSECGLACVAMLLRAHGDGTALSTLRKRFPLKRSGATLNDLVKVCRATGLQPRPLKLDIESLRDLRVPCILHWNLSHFVVLVKCYRTGALIADPARGLVRVSRTEVHDSFTGVALEALPGASFAPTDIEQKASLVWAYLKTPTVFRLLFPIVLAGFALEMIGLAAPWLTQILFDNILASGSRDLLPVIALAALFIVLLNGILDFSRTLLTTRLYSTATIQWIDAVFSRLVSLPLTWFDRRSVGDIISKFNGVYALQHTYAVGFSSILIDGMFLLSSLAIIFIYSGVLGAIALGSFLLYLMIRILRYRVQRVYTRKQLVETARQSGLLVETIRAIQTIKVCGLQNKRTSEFLSASVTKLNSDVSIERQNASFSLIAAVVASLDYAAVLWIGSTLVMDSQLTIGMFTAFLVYKSQFQSRSMAVLEKIIMLKIVGLQGDRLRDIVDEPPRDEDCSAAGGAIRSFERIEAVGLSFRHSIDAPDVFSGLSFTVCKGESIAIAGPSGCGKSTLLKILLRLVDPNSGDLLLDGRSVLLVNQNALRELMSAVLQEDALLSGSIAQNIAGFDESPDTNMILKAADLAAIHSEIMAMPMGYETIISDNLPVVSAGQKQRLLLARALYREPEILILDEGMSNVDLAREEQIWHNLESLAITTIIVSHRPEVIAKANRVVYLRPTQ
jgi:ATP-binding cassette, subfamily B, bacterial CvaB/MchF/RaxB